MFLHTLSLVPERGKETQRQESGEREALTSGAEKSRSEDISTREERDLSHEQVIGSSQDSWWPRRKGKCSNLVLTVQEQENTPVLGWKLSLLPHGMGSSQVGLSNKPAETRGMSSISSQ